jgi:hypothetical protein
VRFGLQGRESCQPLDPDPAASAAWWRHHRFIEACLTGRESSLFRLRPNAGCRHGTLSCPVLPKRIERDISRKAL